MNVYLIGYRCSGKTSVGSALSCILGWSFMDTDGEVVHSAGMSIHEMVAQNGWEAFRLAEKQVIHRTSGLDRHVIATGGGMVLDPENVRLMKASGWVIWLTASSETVRMRMADDPVTGVQRPDLTAAGSLNEIDSVMTARQPLYQNAADLAIDTDDLEIGAVCQKILNFLDIKQDAGTDQDYQ